METFSLSDIQARAILDMRLQKLTGLEIDKLRQEYEEIMKLIEKLKAILADKILRMNIIKEELIEIKEKYGDERRTHIAHDASEAFNEEDLVADEAVLVSITLRGYIKRVMANSFRSQAGGGRGVTGHATKDEDEVVVLLPARTLDTLLFFSDRGKVYSEKAYQIPDADRTGKGIPVVNVLALDPGESITAVVPVPNFTSAEFCIMATRKGRVKRVVLSEFASVRPSGLIAITLDNGDELGWVRLTHGNSQVILVTEHGQVLRFAEEEVRSMGRTAGGVTGIRLAKEDFLTSMEVIEPDAYLMIVTTRGYGKRTSLSEYPIKSRATRGVHTIAKSAIGKVGKITAARVVQEADDLTLISSVGVVLRTKVKDISASGRATRGVLLMNLQEGDAVASLARISAADLRQVGVAQD